jgi:hypothetical protein
VLVIQKSTQTRIKIIGRLPGTDRWVPIDEDESAQEEIPGVVSSSSLFLLRVDRTDSAARGTNQGELKFRQYRAAERTFETSKPIVRSTLQKLTSYQLERYGMQKSHPSDEPRRDSAKALILHMGDVEEIDAS